MKAKFLRLLFCVCLSLCIGFTPALGAQDVTPQNLYKDLLPADPQAWIDGELTQTAGVTAEWYILALRQNGNYNLTAYQKALQTYLEQNKIASASSRLKYALLLAACGADSPYIGQTLADSVGKQGLMSYVYGLHLLNNGYSTPNHTTDSLLATLLAMQLPDGGWAVVGQSGDPDATAMTLQALAPYYATHPQVQAAVDRGLTRLAALQQADGGYSSMGVANPESAAQVLIALSALGIDYAADPRFIKNGSTLLEGILPYRLADGSFSHTLGGNSSSIATAQVFCAGAAYIRLQEGKPGLYMLDAPEVTPPATKPAWGYKEWTSLALAAVALVVCGVLFLRKKRNWRNFIIVLLVTALAVAAVWGIRIQSVDDHAKPQSSGNPTGSVMLQITCQTVAGKGAHIPANGLLLPPTQVRIFEGDTVFDALQRATAQHKIHLDFTGSGTSVYVKGIGNIYELDHGDLSGWIYYVGGIEATQSCGDYPLQNGDEIEWYYTCALGKDRRAN